MGSTHVHPHPASDRLAQYGGVALVVVMIAAALGQVALALYGLPLFLLSGLVTLAMIAPVMMLTSATPAVSIAPDGITIHPRVWRERFVRWSEVRAVKDYPLLPPRDVEAGRRALVGRKKYQAAEGKMLVIPSLPLPYRFTGLFAGEGFTGVIGLTNRTHTEYTVLIRQVMKYTSAEC
ncbi:MAG: hypothetical protein IT319_03990 [Anaerolineae bacterium]|nr:hypothetical protein [Anaerolineae bacterium]